MQHLPSSRSHRASFALLAFVVAAVVTRLVFQLQHQDVSVSCAPQTSTNVTSSLVACPNENRTWEIPPDHIVRWGKELAGFGHKTGNWLSAVIGAQVLGLRAIYVPFETSSTHKNTPKDLPHWMGFDIDEYTMEELPPGYKIVDLPLLPMAAKHYQTYAPAIKHIAAKGECNVLYRINQVITVPNNLGLAQEILSLKYLKARDNTPLPTYLYSQVDINVAIHIRLGDIVPTPTEWHATVAEKLTQLIHSQEHGDEDNNVSFSAIPIKYHVFAGEDGAALAPLKRLPNVTFHFEDARDAMHHMIMSDIFIASASGFSQIAYLAMLKPLIVTPPTREKHLPFVDCHHASHLCLNEHAEFDSFVTMRVLRWRQRWAATKLPQLLGSCRISRRSM